MSKFQPSIQIQLFTFIVLMCHFMASAEIKVEMVPSPRSAIGEGPHWDVKSQSLYYIDMFGTEFTILRYCSIENKVYGALIEGEPHVAFIIPVAGTTDEFLVAIGRRLGIIRWDGKSPKAKVLRIVLEVENCEEFIENVFNDGKADPRGRVYGGSVRLLECYNLTIPTFANLFRYSCDEPTVTLLMRIRQSNGLAWDTKSNTMYYIDSCDWDVKAFDWNPETGDISCGRVVIDFRENGVRPVYYPDGMTIDTEGYLYIVFYGGSRMRKVDPKTGRILKEVFFPCQQTTSVAFGGKNLDILYVTTGADPLRFGPQPEAAGHLYKVTGFRARGKPGDKFRDCDGYPTGHKHSGFNQYGSETY